jgi:spore germination protein GerM
MNVRRVLPIAAGIGLLGLLAWGVTTALERLARPESPGAPGATRVDESGTAHITSTLFYATEGGESLVGVRREVILAEGVVAQGREILTAQLQPAPAPYISAIPAGTTLRAFYATDRGDAFVDLSRDVSTAHTGGSLAELLTVHAVVNAVTENLPAIKRVQILIDGREVDTIAGHVDIRRPLIRDLSLVREEAEQVELKP